MNVLDSAPDAEASEALRAVCAADEFVAAMLAGRPYGSLTAAQDAGAAAVHAMSWPAMKQALFAHPRIGERARGDGREAAWSRQEQSAAADTDRDTELLLRKGNIDYENLFGYVFLICATGLSRPQVLASLRERLSNDATTEQAVVRDELAAIVLLRLAKIAQD